nr:hypothetical protein [Tanacetum cinerariifolium]
MSIRSQGEPLTKRLVASYVTKNDKESLVLPEDLALSDNESWNDPRDFSKPVKALSMPHDAPSAFNHHLIEMKNQVQHPERAFVEYASTHTNEAGNKWYTFKPEENNIGDTYNTSWKSHPNLRLGDSKPFDTLDDLKSCVNLLPLKLFKELKIGLLEEINDVLGLADGTKSYPRRDCKKHGVIRCWPVVTVKELFCAGFVGEYYGVGIWRWVIREMDKGFLNRKSKDKNHVSDGSKSTGSSVSDLTAEIKSIDGKIKVANISDMETAVPMANIYTSHVSTVSNMDVHSVHQNEMMYEVVSELNLGVIHLAIKEGAVVGPSINMVNEPRSHTDHAHITEQNTTSTVSLPKDAVDEIRARFVNTLYGYSVGKRLAFPMVENYVKHAWAKFGSKRVMLNHGFFLFQFDSSTGMEKVMEGGPRRIKLVPIILKVWMPNTILMRENVSIVLLWVKMHNMPIVAYSKGRRDYARALVEVSVKAPLIDSVDVVIPLDDGVGHVMVNISLEYEWQPLRCGTCKNFKHLEAMCPMKLMECHKKKCVNESKLSKGNRPVRVTGRKNKGKQVGNQRQIHGIHFTKLKTKLVYHVVEKSESDKHVRDNMGMSSSDTTKTDTPLDSLRKVYNDDNINIDELRAFVVNKNKPSSSMEVLNAYSNTNEDEVFPPDVGCSRPSSLFGDGHQLEDEILNAYDDYEDQIEDFQGQLQEICDQFDFKIKSLVVGKGLTRSIFEVKELDLGDDNEPYWTTIGKRKSYKPRTSKDGIGAIPINLKGNMWKSKDLIENLIDCNKPPKEGDEKGTDVMKDKVSKENMCEEEVPLNNNIGKQIGDFVDMSSEAVKQGMNANVPDEIDGAKEEHVPNHFY